MIRGIYTGAMGMLAEEARVNNISNNLANVDTAGFKKDSLTFSTYLKKEIFRNQTENHRQKLVPIGTLDSGVVLDESRPYFKQGAVEMTGNEYDFAITGDGFFSVETADGNTYYTRNGQWHRDGDDFLVDSVGNYVLNNAGERITIEDGIRVDRDGSLYENGVLTGRIDLVTFPNPERLRKVGNNYFAQTAFSGEAEESFSSVVIQGGFERANVNAVEEMVNLINAQRHFEIAQRIITTEDQLLDAAVNRVGKV
jgi:flagellar basal-body rod protein FlgG